MLSLLWSSFLHFLAKAIENFLSKKRPFYSVDLVTRPFWCFSFEHLTKIAARCEDCCLCGGFP